jgi:hypothetical protein
MFAEGAEPVHDVKDQSLEQRGQRHARRTARPSPGLVGRRTASSEHLRKGSAKPEDLVTGTAGATRAGAWRIRFIMMFPFPAGMRVHANPKCLFSRKYSAESAQSA